MTRKEAPLFTERGLVMFVENVIDRAEREGMTFYDDTIIPFLVQKSGTLNDDDRTRNYLRHLLTQSRHAGRWPDAEVGASLPTDWK